MRVLFSFLALWSLGAAVLFGVFDIARAVAQSQITMTPFLQSWQDYLPESLAGFSGFIRSNFGVAFWEHWLVPVLSLPSWLLFIILSVLLFIPANLRKKSGLS